MWLLVSLQKHNKRTGITIRTFNMRKPGISRPLGCAISYRINRYIQRLDLLGRMRHGRNSLPAGKEYGCG
ncbi:hypothetical protein AA11825_0124 [Acetobacter pomorum DSM 11825]|nr:hypothetical protein AA11825_0124 [Acetobacter pomorum DSM 11825]